MGIIKKIADKAKADGEAIVEAVDRTMAEWEQNGGQQPEKKSKDS